MKNAQHAVEMGRLVVTPELKHTNPGNIAYSSFSIAVDRDYTKEGQEKRDTDFFDIVCWRGTAEYACKQEAPGGLHSLFGQGVKMVKKH